MGQGLVGAAVAEERPILVHDVLADSRYVEIVPGTRSELVVPLRRKGKVIGALNLLSPAVAQFTELDEAILRQFAAAVAVGIENARLFEKERQYAEMLETLAEIGREVSSILDLDALLVRLAQLTKRLIDYRTFGILLVNEATERARDEAGAQVRREGDAAHGEDGGGAGRLRGASTRRSCSCPTSTPTPATSTRWTTCGRSW